MTHNRLAHESSPYLRQHADNPVHWYAWGSEALAAAHEQDRPILLSIGYAACHWCHVMAHESFEDPGTAAVMNELFVNVKVDREERPDLDAIYQQALALMGEHGGWPLTMFCTPDGKPFWGGTYFPPTARWGRPGFPDLLRHIAAVYRDDRDKVVTNTSAILDAIDRLSRPEPGEPMSASDIADIVRHMADAVDKRHGGFGDAPKFPQAPILRLMWAAGQEADIPQAHAAVALSLERMAQGGIYDHLGGGFARYATDAAWLVPHFEKMLYDNAQLLEVYTMAWRTTGEMLFAERVAETAGWVLREMTDPSGGFHATLDADSEGEEGRFYVWDEAEIRDILGPAFDLFAAAYDIRPGGNWEGRTILNRSADSTPRDDTREAGLAAARERLFATRSSRVRPGLDDKVLADWNGLMIAALADAAMAFDRPDWLAAARNAYDFVTRRMVRTETSGTVRLIHSWRNGDGRAAGNLDDHAQMARAALILHEATGDPACVTFAQSMVDTLERLFATNGYGAYNFTPDDAGDVIARTCSGTDTATPSGNGAMIEVLARLYHLTGRATYRERADAILRVFSGEARKSPFGFATLLTGQLFLEAATHIVIRGEPGDDGTRALAATSWTAPVPTRIVQLVPDGEPLPDDHPAAGKDRIGGRATAYVCRGRVCSPPVTSPEDLLHELTA